MLILLSLILPARYQGVVEPFIRQDSTDAIKLGIEALKRQQGIRGKKSTTLTYPLLGETKE